VVRRVSLRLLRGGLALWMIPTLACERVSKITKEAPGHRREWSADTTNKKGPSSQCRLHAVRGALRRKEGKSGVCCRCKLLSLLLSADSIPSALTIFSHLQITKSLGNQLTFGGTLRLWSFQFIDNLTDDAALYRQLAIEPINIAPF